MSRTSVAVERSQADIRSLLVGYIAEGYRIEERREPSGQEWGVVEWGYAGQRVRFEVPVEQPNQAAIEQVARRARTRKREEIEEDEREGLRRETWRSLAQSIGARMRAVGSGVETFEEAFLAHLLTPSGQQLYVQLAGGPQGSQLGLPAPTAEVVTD